MKRPDLTFKTKALLLLGGLQLAGLLVLGYLSYDQSQEGLRRLTEDQIRLTTQQVSREVAYFVRGESQTLMMLAQMTPLQSVLQVRDSMGFYTEGEGLYEMWLKQTEQTFLAMAALRPQCLDLVYTDNSSRDLVHIRCSEGACVALDQSQLGDRADAPYIRRAGALQSGQVHVEPAAPGRADLWLATPIFDPKGDRAGTLAMHIDPADLLGRIENPLPGGRVLLVDQRGQVLYGHDQSTAQNLADIHPALTDRLAQPDAPHIVVACELDGHTRAELCLHSYGRIPYDPLDSDNYWAVVLDAPVDVIFAPADQLRDRFLGWGTLIVALSLGLTLALSQATIVRPILHLEQMAERVAGGDLTSPAPSATDRDWREVNDEIGRLYASFGTMVDRLRQASDHLQEQIRVRTTELEQSEARLEQQNGELARLNNYKSHLLSVVSHELKTPLSSLDGFSRIIGQIFLTEEFADRLDPEHRETVQQVRLRLARMDQNVLRLIRLVDELLDFSRIDRGKGLEMRREDVDLGPVLVETVDNHRALAQGLEVAWEGPLDPVGLRVHADVDRIVQVFDNLLNNAIKFTEGGEGVRVGAAHRGDYLEFTVRDSGEGFAPEDSERIFDLYEQAGDQPSRKLGTGIGLAIARYIVTEHDGYIRADSPGAGLGALFTVGLPRTAAVPLLNAPNDEAQHL